jgi:hypothetical protein
VLNITVIRRKIIMVDSKKVFEFLAADRKYVRIRWNATGREEVRFVKAVNPGTFDLLHQHENSWRCTRLYPEDIGTMVTLVEVLKNPA